MMLKDSDERRGEKRKTTGRFPGEIGPPTARATPLKKTPDDMPANVFVGQLANCFVLDVSTSGLKISSSLEQLEPKRKIGVLLQIPDNGGVALICQVRWHQPWANGMEHWTGLQILSTTDDKSFTAFVDKLPYLET